MLLTRGATPGARILAPGSGRSKFHPAHGSARCSMQGAVSYHQHYRRCGKPNCRRCSEGPGHGPYWYATWRDGAHVRTRYIGKEPPPDLDVSAADGQSTPPTNGGETRRPRP